MTNEPSGLGEAKFTMTVDEVRGHYPELKELNEDLGASVVGGPFIARYVLRKHKVPGLAKPTDVELRFWKGKLWVIVVYFGDNDADSVLAMLRKQMGPPTAGDESHPMWRGETRQVTVNLKPGWYGMTDNALSAEAQEWFAEILTGRRPAAPPPAKAADAKGTPAEGSPSAGLPPTPAASPTGAPAQ